MLECFREVPEHPGTLPSYASTDSSYLSILGIPLLHTDFSRFCKQSSIQITITQYYDVTKNWSKLQKHLRFFNSYISAT